MRLKVGDYAMHHMSDGPRGTLVRVLEETSPGRFGVGYVQLVANSVVSGGSSWSWPEAEFRPITDPLYMLAARLDAAGRAEAEANAVAATKRAEADSIRGAIRALLDAQESARSSAAVDPNAPNQQHLSTRDNSLLSHDLSHPQEQPDQETRG